MPVRVVLDASVSLARSPSCKTEKSI